MPYAYAAVYELFAYIGAEISYATAAAIVNTAVATAVSYSVSAYSAAEQRRKAKAAYNASLEDRAVVIRSAVAARPIVYGETIVGGPIVFIGSEGDKQENLHVVIALAGHEINDIVDVLFDGNSIGPLLGPDAGAREGGVAGGMYAKASLDYESVQAALDESMDITVPAGVAIQSVVLRQTLTGDSGFENDDTLLTLNVDYTISGNVVHFNPDTVPASAQGVVNYQVSTGAPYVFCFKYLGGPDQVASELLQLRFPGVWTENHVGNGVAYVHLMLVYDTDLFPNGVPEVKFQVQGKKCYDPRTETTQFTKNPALQARDYLTDPLGFNCDASEINDDLVIAAANICDEQLQYQMSALGEPIYQARYVGAGVVSTESDRKDNFEQIMSAMGPGEAGATYVQGKWNLYAGAYRSPVMSLSEKDLTSDSPITIVPKLSRADLYNTVHGTYIDPLQQYQAIDFPPVTNATYQFQDGGELLIKDIELPFTDDNIRAQRMAKAMIERSRASCMFTASFKMSAYRLAAYDTVSLSIGRYGFVSKPFDVVERAFDPRGGITLTLREANPTMWNWSYLGIQLTQPPPPSQLPNPFTVEDLVLTTSRSDDSTIQIQDDGTIIPRVFLEWAESDDANVFFSGTVEIQYQRAGDTWWGSVAPIRGQETQTYLIGPKAGGVYTVRLRFVNGLGITSPYWTYTTLAVQGKTTPPSDVTGVAVTPQLYGLKVRWNAVADRDLGGYELRVGPSFETAVSIFHGRATSYVYPVDTAGDYKFWVKAQDTSGNYSVNAALADFEIVIPAASSLAGSINGSEMVLTWAAVTGTFAIDHYELRQGATWNTAVPLTSDSARTVTLATTYRQQVKFGGTQTFWVAAIDVAGNVGTAASTTITINNPANVLATVSVIDNFVYLRLADAITTLPVTRYVIRKGTSFAGGADVGDNGDGRFAVFFESSSGLYTYWTVAYDTAGNASTPTSVFANVDQPPDYILQADVHSTFGGSRVNAVVDDALLYAPLIEETWQDHFVNGSGTGSGSTFDPGSIMGAASMGAVAMGSGPTVVSGGSGGVWATPQDQVDAGFPLYFEPSASTGSYEEVLDYGAALATTTITATMSFAQAIGSIGVTCTISYKANASDPWTIGPTGQTQVVASNFRYARVHYDFVAMGTTGQNLLAISDLEIKLSVKLRNDAGMGTASAGDVGGTFVPFNYAFIDVSSITVTGADTAAAILTYAFVDVPNPSGFYVYAWDKNGSRVTKPFSWSAKGY